MKILNKAFTLLEILLVIIVIGVILGLAAPNFTKGFSRFELDETSEDILSTSRWAQAMAISQQRIYALAFTEDRRSYNLVLAKTDADTGAQDGYEPLKSSLGRLHKISDSIKLRSELNYIQFYPDGTMDETTIELSSLDKKLTLSTTAVRGMMTKVNP